MYFDSIQNHFIKRRRLKRKKDNDLLNKIMEGKGFLKRDNVQNGMHHSGMWGC